MLLFDANGEIWNPHREDTRALDDVLRRIVDALRYRRYRRPHLDDVDAYSQALIRLSEAATEYTAVLRTDPAAAGEDPVTGRARRARWRRAG